MQNVLIVVDMQNDFITGALGTIQAILTVPNTARKIKGFHGKILFTRDTCNDAYLHSQIGTGISSYKCVANSPGWQICPELMGLCNEPPIDKTTIVSFELGDIIKRMNDKDTIQSVTLIGLCTDICVFFNAMMIKKVLPRAEIIVDASCCSGVTPERHTVALFIMKLLQIKVENEYEKLTKGIRKTKKIVNVVLPLMKLVSQKMFRAI